ncbi:MAG: hypothetical protein CMJ51_03385 [Planctomycetaceae bacterium]|nr:hypothetical protein [Planctomycetaceae bacterium]
MVLAVAVLLALPGGLFATLVGLDFRRITPVLIERMERCPIHFRGMRRGAVIAAVTTGIGSGSLPALVRLIPPRPAS